MDEPKTTAPENSDPSERMPGKLGKRRATEKQRHIDAFQLYLKLGTIELVAKAINRSDKVVQAWSAKYQWVTSQDEQLPERQ